MVLQVNNFTNFDSTTVNELSKLTHDRYPEQDERFVGKITHLKYRDFANRYFSPRLNINRNKHPEFIHQPGEEQGDGRWWRILRFDKTDDGKGIAICIDRDCRVIVCNTKDIDDLRYPPEYVMADCELWRPFSRDWDDFNKSYIREITFGVPIQNTDLVGIPVVTEYYKDILTYDSAVNRLKEPKDQHKTFEQIKKQLQMIIADPNDPKLERIPDVILRSFPLYFPRHEHNMVDVPRRAMNIGVILRCDESGVFPNSHGLVVAEYMSDGSIRFVTGKEAFIYYEEDSRCTNIAELKLFSTFTRI